MQTESLLLPTRTFSTAVSIPRSFHAVFSGSGAVTLVDDGGHEPLQYAALEFPDGTATSLLLPRTFNVHPSTPGVTIGAGGEATIAIDSDFGFMLTIQVLSAAIVTSGRVLY